MIALLIAFIFAITDDDYDTEFNYRDEDPGRSDSVDCEDLKTPPEGGIVATEYKYYRCGSSYGTDNQITISGNTIGNYAFYKCNAISVVTLPDKLVSIGIGAFSRCEYLTTIKNFPDSLTSIGDGAFYESPSLASIPQTIPTKLGSIGVIAFAECPKLTTALTIANRVSESGTITQLNIMNGAFYNSKVLIPTTIQSFVSVQNSAFEGCPQGSTVRDVTFNGKVIGNSAFRYCTYLNLILGNDCTISSIGEYAFQGTSTKGTPKFPDELKTINQYAYAGTDISGTIDFNDVRTIGDYAFSSTKIDKIILSEVRTIREGAFDYSSVNDAVTFSADLESIGEKAFRGTGVTDLTIPQGTISSNAFEKCKKIGTVTYGTEYNSYTYGTISDEAFIDAVIDELNIRRATISSNSFENSEINNVKITDSKILGEAFLNAKIDTLAIIDPLSRVFSGETILDGAFSDAEIKTSINLTDVRYVGDGAFEGFSKRYSPTLTFSHDSRFNAYNNMYQIGDSAFKDTTIKLTNPSFDSTYSELGESAFEGCRGVSGDVYLNVPTIGDSAFKNTNLDGEVTLGPDTGNLPTTEEYIDSKPVYYCHLFEGCNLRAFNISSYTHNIPARLFHGMTQLTGDLTISTDVGSIGEEAFLGCGLTSLTIEPNPHLTLTIGKRAFYKCKNMESTNLTLLRDISTIEEFTFYQCERISGVTFSSSTTKIGAYAFAQTGLTSLQLPRLLGTIGEGAFKSCTKLNGDLDIPDTVADFGSYAFYQCPFSNGKLTTGYHLSSIPDYAFYQCKFSSDLVAPRLESIGDYAFYECTNLHSVEFTDLYTAENSPNSHTFSIGNSAFQGCTGLTGSLPIQYCNSIGRNAFHGCSEITGGLEFYDSKSDPLTVISDYAFYGCSKLNGQIIFPSTLESINQYAFYGCTDLVRTLNFPTSLKLIGDYAFSGDSNLYGELTFRTAGVYDTPSIEYIGQYAFNGCSHLNGTLNIENAAIVGSHAFAGCTGLSGPLEFGTSLTTIGNFAFEGCSGFSDTLTFNKGTSGTLNIGRGAFKDCTGFKNGLLFFDIAEVEKTPSNNHVYHFNQFLKIQNEAFENTKFKNIYYNGRFEPDCDLDIGFNGNKGIKTSSHYANKSFCGNPLHSNKLSGGAIAGIVIACIVVVAIIVAVIVYFIIRNKRNKDNSEAEVEMNQDP